VFVTCEALLSEKKGTQGNAREKSGQNLFQNKTKKVFHRAVTLARRGTFAPHLPTWRAVASIFNK
jgi:hypothetical protein